MRVIAGEFKSRRLRAVKGQKTRPTLDQVKESLFSRLGDLVVDARVLDLFCGAGGLAIEALSRGAASAVLIDLDRQAREVALHNLRSLELESRSEVLGGDACRVIRRLASREDRFDLIFVDPPYFENFGPAVLSTIKEGKILRPSGRLVFEHHKKESPDTDAPGWQTLSSRQTGDTVVTFFQLLSGSAEDTMESENRRS